MKKLVALLLITSLLGACSVPLTYTMLLDVRHSSEAGIDPEGKSVAILYMDDSDSLISSIVVDGMVQSLEKRFFDGKKSVGAYSTGAFSDAVFTRDSLIPLMVSLGCDLLIALDNPVVDRSDSSRWKVNVNLYAYDSFDKSDVVRKISSRASVVPPYKDSVMFISDVQLLGHNVVLGFGGRYESEVCSFIYFDSFDGRWSEAVSYADQFEWDKACKIWMKLSEDSSDPIKKSCAAYNMALSMYLMGNRELALKWLDVSDGIHPVSMSSSLRERIAKG